MPRWWTFVSDAMMRLRMVPVILCLLAALWIDPRSMRLPDSERWFAQIGATLAGRDKPWSRRLFKDVKAASAQALRNLPR